MPNKIKDCPFPELTDAGEAAIAALPADVKKYLVELLGETRGQLIEAYEEDEEDEPRIVQIIIGDLRNLENLLKEQESPVARPYQERHQANLGQVIEVLTARQELIRERHAERTDLDDPADEKAIRDVAEELHDRNRILTVAKLELIRWLIPAANDLL